MDRGIYTATSAGLFQMRKLELINNNLANINTPGFKGQMLTAETESFDQTLASQVVGNDPFAEGDHERTPPVYNMRSVTDFTAGPVKNTGSPLDVALRDPKDFFAINTPDGIQYTRAGNFTLNSSNELVTQDGCQVQGDGGAIAAVGAGVSINADGTVTANKLRVGRLSVVHFDDPKQLERVGANRYKAAQGASPTEVEADLIPQSLEMANVSAISSMVDLITTQRAFQAYAKVSDTIDQLNQAAINQVGRPRG